MTTTTLTYRPAPSPHVARRRSRRCSWRSAHVATRCSASSSTHASTRSGDEAHAEAGIGHGHLVARAGGDGAVAGTDERSRRIPLAAERAFDAERSLRCRGLAEADTFARTELFFGLSRPGGIVTDAEFKAFVDTWVTPRFPDGLTLLSGVGQFRDASGTTIAEGAKLLILLYPRRDRDADAKIEQIRVDYKRMFQQQSVLRTDDLSCVSF